MEQIYEIRVQGHVGAAWSEWFDGLQVINLDKGDTLIRGRIPDQAALHGLLARIQALNLTLIGVSRIQSDPPR
jgi:hypothetical protein